MESQTELAQPAFKVVKELFRILPVLKSNHEVIRVSHDNRVSVRLLRTPFPVKPEVEDVVEVNICQNWRNNRSLGSPPKVVLPLAPVHDASVQPLGDQPNDPPVSDPMLQKPDQPVSVQIIERPHDTLPTSTNFPNPSRLRAGHMYFLVARSGCQVSFTARVSVSFCCCSQMVAGGSCQRPGLTCHTRSCRRRVLENFLSRLRMLCA